MIELRDFLCDDVIGIVGDYLHGDKEYWKDNYNLVVKEMRIYDSNNVANCEHCNIKYNIENNFVVQEHLEKNELGIVAFFINNLVKYCDMVNRNNTGKENIERHCNDS